MENMQRALPFAPTAQAAHTGPSMQELEVLVRGGRYLDAVEPLFKRLAQDPDNIQLLDMASVTAWFLNQHETAVALIKRLLEVDPGHVASWTKLGEMQVFLGNFEVAEAALNESLRQKSKNPAAFNALLQIRTFSPDSTHFKTMRDMLSSKKLPKDQKARLAYGLGKCEHKHGNHKRAFHYFSKAKKLNGGHYSPKQSQVMRHSEARFVTPENMVHRPTRGEASDAPVFVVGMPRSGTTLLEKMLLQHPKVASIGESPALSAINQTLQDAHAHVPDSRLIFSWMQDVSDLELDSCGRGYMQNALRQVGEAGDATRIIDKMPLNCHLLPLVHQILPNARVIFMRRHPLDVGLSNFSMLFQDGHAYANRLDWVGDKIRSVYASIEHARSYMGDRLREQSYQALVEDPEGQARQLLDFLELDWDEAVMRPEDTEGAVLTASVTQVRKGINRLGLNKWRDFENELAPLVESLGGQAWIDAWEAETAAIAANSAR